MLWTSKFSKLHLNEKGYQVKKVKIISSLFLILLVGCATVTTKSIPVEKKLNIPNTKMNDLYVRANNWMVDTFRNAKSVVQFSDKEAGVISGRYLLGTVVAPSEYGPGSSAYAQIKILVKDNAAKIIVTPEPFSYMKGNMYTLYTEEDAKKDIENLIISLDSSMLKSDNTNW